jgi:hypothetical protein
MSGRAVTADQLAALYADHEAVDPTTKAALVLPHVEHRHLPFVEITSVSLGSAC